MAKRRTSALENAIGQLERRSAGIQSRTKPAPAPRFAASQRVDAATAERTKMRLNRLQGARPKGINVTDGVTGREARLARLAVANERPLLEATAVRREHGTQRPAPTQPLIRYPTRHRRIWA